MKTIARIDSISLGKTIGALYAMIGLVFGALITLISILGSVTFSKEGSGSGIFFGIGAIIILPALYGTLGFVFGLISGWLYNLTVKWTGGLKIEIQDTSPKLKQNTIING